MSGNMSPRRHRKLDNLDKLLLVFAALCALVAVAAWVGEAGK